MSGEELRRIAGTVPIGSAGEATGRRAADSKAATEGVEHAKNAADRPGTSDVETFGEPVPQEFTADPLKMRTEWGWRRFLVQAWAREFDAQSEQAAAKEPYAAQELLRRTTPPAPFESTPSLQTLVRALWQTFHSLLQEPIDQSQKVNVSDWMAQGALLPLSDMKMQNFHDPAVPEKIKRAAIAEKLQLAVHTNDVPLIGSGLYYPPGVAGEDRRTAVFWQAERQVVVNRQGERVHHLVVMIEVDTKPLELMFVFLKPSLTLHIRTDDAKLREGLIGAQEVAKMSLQALGWEVMQFSVGSISDGKGELSRGT